eukprot:7150618-Prymnesium_polylepis.1
MYFGSDSSHALGTWPAQLGGTWRERGTAHARARAGRRRGRTWVAFGSGRRGPRAPGCRCRCRRACQTCRARRAAAKR